MRNRKGFTIIEVVLFLAISGAVLAAIIAGTASVAAKRRYNDAVSDLAENIRNVYSSTVNVENTRIEDEETTDYCSISAAYNTDGTSTTENTKKGGVNDNYPGRTRCAVYGQLITFGEQNKTIINRYDIIGIASTENIDPAGSIDIDGKFKNDDILQSLIAVGADVVNIKKYNGTNQVVAELAGTTSRYIPQWESSITAQEKKEIYKGAVMVARSPISGTIHTYFYSDHSERDINKNNTKTLEIQEWLENHKKPDSIQALYQSGYSNFLGGALRKFEMVDGEKDGGLTICLDSDDLFAVSNQRRAIRIKPNGSNESAVEVLTDEGSKVCK